MNPPRAVALRLVTRAGGRPPRPPFGLVAWSTEAAAVAVLLDATDANPNDAAVVAAQIPRARDLPAGTPIFVLGAARRGRGVLSWIGMGAVAAGRAARCTALIARGYVAVGASVDDASGADLAWGFSSPC